MFLHNLKIVFVGLELLIDIYLAVIVVVDLDCPFASL